jgi:uncharacterized coiled-coil protein SlyX
MKNSSSGLELHLQQAETMRKYRDMLVEKEREMEILRKEIKALKTVEKRQTKTIAALDQEKGDLPKMINSMSEEIRILREKLREYQSRHISDEKTLQVQNTR